MLFRTFQNFGNFRKIFENHAVSCELSKCSKESRSTRWENTSFTRILVERIENLCETVDFQDLLINDFRKFAKILSKSGKVSLRNADETSNHVLRQNVSTSTQDAVSYFPKLW
jgi:hypothetical protein